MLDLVQIESFVSAAEAGSFVKAGRRLALSPQMVGKHVASLEEQLGTALIMRSTRRQSLTEAGRHLLESGRAVLQAAAAAEDVVRSSSSEARGKLRISAPSGYGAAVLAPAVARFMRSHPQIEVDLRLTDRFVDLFGEGFDAVVRFGPLADSAMLARRLPDCPLVACAAPSYLKERGVPGDPRELEGHECLGYSYWDRPPPASWRFKRGDEQVEVPIRPRLQIDDGHALRAALLEGFGLTILPVCLVAADIKEGRLVALLNDFTCPPREVRLLFADAEHLSRRLRTFIDYMVENLSR